jgi:UDP-N-acetyl-2-amino-2-deoxyglucuronate dehydrogenase
MKPGISDRLRIGIVGAGQIALNHAKAVADLAEAELTAVCDVDLKRAQSLADLFRAKHAFEDLDAMMDSGLDAVTVCTPHPVHEQVVVAAADHRLHVLCEKPIAVTLEATDRMIAATRDAGVRLGVVFQRRLMPAVQRIRAALDDGTLGRPIAGHCHVRLQRDAAYYSEPWRGHWETEGGGALINQAIHHIDMLQWFLGEPVRVSGQCRTLKHGDYIEVEDTAAAVIEFGSGALATLQVGTTYDPSLGDQVLITDDRGQTVSVTEFPEGAPGYNDIWAIGGRAEYLTHPSGIEHNRALSQVHADLVPFHTAVIQEFVHAVRDNRDPLVTGAEARKSLAIILGIYESSRTGRLVQLDSNHARYGETR